MEKQKQFWKISLIMIGILVPLLAWLVFGKRGLVELYHSDQERQAYEERIRRIDEENRALYEEINRLKTDMEYIESVARKELNLIREDEVMYRFNTDQKQE
jgi:cell division protein FtsB